MENITSFTFFLSIVSALLFAFGVTAFVTIFVMEKRGNLEKPERLVKLRSVVSKLMLGFIPFLLMTVILLVIGIHDQSSFDTSVSIFEDFFNSFGLVPLDTLSVLFGLDSEHLIVSIVFLFLLYVLLGLGYLLFHCFLVRSILKTMPEVHVLLLEKERMAEADDGKKNFNTIYLIVAKEKVKKPEGALSVLVNGGTFYQRLLASHRLKAYLRCGKGPVLFYDLRSNRQDEEQRTRTDEGGSDAKKKRPGRHSPSRSVQCFDSLWQACQRPKGALSRLTRRELTDVLLRAYYEESRVKKILPQGKIHLMKFRTEDRDLLENFEDEYIEKEVSRCIDNQTIDLYQETGALLNAFSKGDFHLFVGPAGAGKSTLLLSLFCYLRKALLHPTEKKDLTLPKAFPIFIDLNNLEDDTGTRRHDVLESNFSAFLELRPEDTTDGECRKELELLGSKTSFCASDFFGHLLQEGYTPFFLFDAVDENSMDSLPLLLSIRKFLKKQPRREGESYVAITSRQNAVEFIKTDKDHFLLKDALSAAGRMRAEEKKADSRIPVVLFDIHEFDEGECQAFLRKVRSSILTERILDEGECDRKIQEIERKLDVLQAFYGNVNPFFASTMTNPSFLERKEETESLKIMELISDAIFYTFLGRTCPKRFNLLLERDVCFLEVLGFYAVLTRESGERIDWLDLTSYLNQGLSSQFYDRLRYFKDEKYLLDSQGRFYHEIFTEFFAAAYLYNTLTKANLAKEEYRNLLSLLFNEKTLRGEKVPTLLKRFILLFDWEENRNGNRGDEDGTSLDLLLRSFAQRDPSLLKDVLLFFLEELARNTDCTRIVEDEKGESLTLTYSGRELIAFLHRRAIEFSLEEKSAFDYDFFYRLSSLTEDPSLILHSMERILSDRKDEVLLEDLRLPLSALRDALVNNRWNKDRSLEENLRILHRGLSSDGRTPRFAPWQIPHLLELFSRGERTYRDLLNLSILSEEPLSLSPSELKKMIGFSDIFDLTNFIANKEVPSSSTAYDYPCGEDESLAFTSFSPSLERERRAKVLSLVVDTDIPRQDMESFMNLRTLEVHPGKRNPTTVPAELFSKLDALRNVQLFEGLVEIQEFAFYDLNRLEEINVPESVVILGESVFEDNFLLTHVTLPTSHPLKIGPFLFESDASLQRIDVRDPDGKVHGEFSEGMFLRCKSVTSLDDLHLSPEMTEILPFFFSGMRSLRKMDLSSFSSLRHIARLAFSDIPGLQLTLPPSVEQIDYFAFALLEEKEDPSSPFAFRFRPEGQVLCSQWAFEGREEGREILADPHFRIKQDEEKCNCAILVRRQDGTYRLDHLFHKDGIVQVTDKTFAAGGSVTEIHAYLFETMPNLKSFELTGIEQVGDWLFERCGRLKQVHFRDARFSSAPAHMFEKCRSLAKVTLPAVETLEESCFEDCFRLESIRCQGLSSDEGDNAFAVRTVGPRAFWNANKIRSLTFLEEVLVHPDSFRRMHRLERIDFRKGVRIVGEEGPLRLDEIRHVLFGDKDVELTVGP